METVEKSKNGHTFTDLGEMIEFDITGGIVELQYNPEIAFQAEFLRSYPRPQAKTGKRLIMPSVMVISEDLTSLLLPKSEEVDKPYRGQRGFLDRVGRQCSMVSPM